MKDKNEDLPNEWKLYSMCKVPQQDKTNTTDCGVFVCMYCSVILMIANLISVRTISLIVIGEKG